MTTVALKKIQKLLAAGRLDQADQLCKKVLKRNPLQVDALHIQGIIALNRKHFDTAIQSLKKSLKINHNSAANHYNLSLAYHGNGKIDLALQHLRKTIELQPDMVYAHRDLCGILNELNDFERAIQAGMVAVKLAPQDASVNYTLATSLQGWRDFEGSFKYYQRANELLPDNPAILLSLAQTHLGRGETETAKKLFKRVIELHPKETEPYRQLMRLKKYDSPDHEDIRRIKAMQKEPWLTDDNRTAIYFMLSKAYKDCGLHDEAFDYAIQGNAIQDKKHRFDPDEFSDYITSLINYFTPERMKCLRQLGNDTNKPVFIVGTPRSGTTLTEQILCSHPDVFGAGELNWVSHCIDVLPSQLSSAQSYPTCLNDMTKSGTSELALKFLKYLELLASGEDRVTDKMPANFLHLGFINILFPNARIIHCQRDPRDACISMFFEYFPGVVTYSYDLYKLGAYYSQYLRLMDHWRTILPEGAMLEIEYESIVQNQEEETRRMLSFLELEWDEACLSFHEKKRRVFTASHLQVKKPLYSSSIDRWKKYQKHLQPLEDGFNSQPRG